jgi:hypothetical protein
MNMKDVADLQKYAVMQASMYRPPIDQYPNSENIQPPMKKDKVRVIEQMDRSPVAYDSTKDFHKKLDELMSQRQNAEIIKYKKDGSIDPSMVDVGQLLNIEV